MQKINTLIALFIILLFVTGSFEHKSVAANNTLPDMGSSTNKILPLTMEQQLGDYYMRILRQQLPIIDDPQIREYINELGFRLVASNDDANNRQFYFFVVNDPSINAFAMPGGYIGINTGLIQNAESVSELAGVMAHEIAHVTQRHLARRIEKQEQMSMPMLLATLGSVLVMTQNSEAGIAAMTGLQAGVSQIMINYTRTNESEADRIGIITLANANFDPAGMGRFFEKMLKLSRYRGKRLAFLSTHPLSQTRITESRDRARVMKVDVKENNFKFNLFKERLANFLPRDNKSLKQTYEKKFVNMEDGQLSISTKFGYALILIKLAQYDTAFSILKKLNKQYPKNLYFLLALAEAYTKSGDPESAITLLEKPYRLNPGNDPITMTYSQALLVDKQIKKSLDILYEHLPRVEKEPSIYEIIAEAQSSDGLFKEVHESTGLYLYHSGDLQGALAQFKMAMKGRSDDPYFNSRLLARIKKVQKEILDTR
ncbi:MAG: M48 family metallopeptidase [Gammaproteobacteria bacterium]|nr:M48 family metallopeptidase [Gammaproteobacteria bacterium]